MPTLDDMQAAVPRCPHTVLARRPQGSPSIPMRVKCYTPLCYLHAANVWYCRRCHAVTKGTHIVAVRNAVATLEAAA